MDTLTQNLESFARCFAPMCWQANASMATTPRCPFWTKPRRSVAVCGPMFGTTGRLVVRRRQQPCSTTPAIRRESIRSGTWRPSRAWPMSLKTGFLLVSDKGRCAVLNLGLEARVARRQS